MPLSGGRLGSAMSADILTAINAAFPTDAGLLPAEKTAINSAKAAFANAIGTPSGADVVTEITGHALLNVTGVTPGPGTAAGTIT